MRTIQAPGIEKNEFDRSQYNVQNSILDGAPYCLICGFADKGDNYTIKYLNSKPDLVQTYGQPQTEFEKYFYNGCLEIIKNGGICLAAKLPYYNASLDRYTYCDYCIDPVPSELSSKFNEVCQLDSSLTSCIEVRDDSSFDGSGKMTMKELDDLKTGDKSSVYGKMRIVDISRSNYSKSSQSTVSSVVKDGCGSALVQTNDCLGIVPVVVSPVNALFFQDMLQQDADGKTYSSVNALSVVNSAFMEEPGATLTADLSQLQDNASLVVPLSSSASYQQSVSRVAALQFPSIVFSDPEHLDKTYLKCIGIVVLKAYRDDANSGQVGFQLLESFIGSLDKNAKDQSTGASMYIDSIVNSQSKWINVFTNVPSAEVQQASIVAASCCTARSLGFYELDLQKSISLYGSVLDPLSKILARANNPNQYPIDLVVDAGVSNIAQYTASRGSAYIPSSFVYKLETAADAEVWQTVLKKLDDFCKHTRRDCMLIADGHRGFCLLNDSKIVRDTDPSSSVQTSILPKLKLMSGLNSSFAAGYCNWFLAQDDYSGDLFWCPPSVKVLRSYIYCDTYCHPWSVPAGLKRGTVQGAVDVAFQPNVDEAGKIYSQSWNYAVSYPADGIVVEGQKTFQKAYTALDRVNVRRLMLYLEKQTVRLARRFLYEGNTPYTRQQFVDAITPVFDDAVSNSGILEYAIKCDAELNTQQVIDNNEMRCKIAVKPVKALEFLVLDFIVTNQTADVNEEVRR